MAKVIRDGVLHLVPARELVPGDRIELEAGDNIPADVRLLSGFGVRVQEAALTGESVPVDKDADCVLNENSPLGDRRNMVYMGTVTAAGKASAIVVAIGMDTELGHIAGLSATLRAERTPYGGWRNWARCWYSSAWSSWSSSSCCNWREAASYWRCC